MTDATYYYTMIIRALMAHKEWLQENNTILKLSLVNRNGYHGFGKVFRSSAFMYQSMKKIYEICNSTVKVLFTNHTWLIKNSRISEGLIQILTKIVIRILHYR